MWSPMQAKARALGPGVVVHVRTYNKEEFDAKLLDAGLRTVWLITLSDADMVLRYDDIRDLEEVVMTR